MEFRIIRRLTESKFQNLDLLEHNPLIGMHNRYSNIIPFKQSLVELPLYDNEDPIGCYINACFINGIKSNEKR